MKMFNSKGMINFPVVKRRKQPRKDERIIIQECYCPNGHNLVSSRVQFKKLNGISLKVKSVSGSGIVFLSPICGDKSRISLDIDISDGEILTIYCPKCNAKLPVYGPCACGGELIVFFMDKKFQYSNCIGVCNRVGCYDSMIKTGNELRRCSMLNIK